MSGPSHSVRQGMRGTIRSRLLLNALVDPDEAAQRLPAGLRPNVGDGTVVGCCLLDLAAIRPTALPAFVGTSLRAAAHRISVEWEDESGVTAVGVYVPLRLTDSHAAIALGGQLFPGVHGRASIDLTYDDQQISGSVEARNEPGAYSVRVDASSGDAAQSPCEPMAVACLGAELGLSPGRDGVLETARMTTALREAYPVAIHRLDSAFLASFASATPAPSYLMRDVDVTWTRAPAGRLRRVPSVA